MRHLIVALSFMFIAVSSFTPASAAEEMTEERVKQIIENHLKENPKMIMEALQAWQIQKKVEEQKEQQKAVKDNHDALFNEADDPVAGNKDGDVTIVEFFDYNCPACKMMLESIEAVLLKDKNVRVVFKEFPIFGKKSDDNAKVALAVYQLAPNKYFDFHAAIMRQKGKVDQDYMIRTAKNLGIDETKLKEEIKKPVYDEMLKKDRELAGRLKVRGTPAVIIGDVLIPSALDAASLERQVKAAREKKKEKK